MKKYYVKLAWGADTESDEDVRDMSEAMRSSLESRRCAVLSADGWSDSPDGPWRKTFDDAEWMPKCEVGYIIHALSEIESRVKPFMTLQMNPL